MIILALGIAGLIVIGPDDASAWSAKLQRHRPNLNLDFQRGPWHVRVSEASRTGSCAWNARGRSGPTRSSSWST